MTSCPRFPGPIPQLVTLHDLNFHHHPEWYGRAFRQWLEHTAVPGLRKARCVVCISEYVRRDAERSLGLDPARLRVVPNGLKALARPGDFARDRHAPPTVLAVNPWQPHKNLARLVDAVDTLRARHPGLRLRVAGRPHANFKDQPDLAVRVEREFVDVLGYLSDEDLAREMATATLLCLPSLEEGFGLPVIEAMHLGTPVVTSNRSCLPEIAGDAAELVDPLSVESIAAGIARVLEEDDAERERRRRRGFARAARYRWNDVARAYLEIYDELIG